MDKSFLPRTLLKHYYLNRYGYATDVASYRRRVQDQRARQLKNPTEKRAELLITLDNKLKAAETNFNVLDTTLRKEIQWVIDNKHTLVHKQMVMCMCCYEDFYKRAHDQFASVVAQLPTDHRNEALNTIADSFAQGKLAPVDRRGK